MTLKKILLILSFPFVIICCFIAPFVEKCFFCKISPPGSLDRLAQFGDSFGALNTLFSGLAFAGLIFTIFQQQEAICLQQKELRQNTAELKAQKEELARQRQEQEEQNKTLALQRFETSFFKLLELKNTFVRDTYLIDISQPNSRAEGIAAFRRIAQNLEIKFKNHYPPTFSEKDLSNRPFTHSSSELATYIQIISRNYFFVKKSQLVTDKEGYFSCIDATLSPEERTCLFFHALTSTDELSELLFKREIFHENLLYAHPDRIRNGLKILEQRYGQKNQPDPNAAV